MVEQKLELICFLQDTRGALNQLMDETRYTNLIYIRDEIDKVIKELEMMKPMTMGKMPIDSEEALEIECYLKKTLGAWVDIDLDHAFMCIEKRPSYCDRGRYLLKAWHKMDKIQDCYIDEADNFPRYYFNFDCMIMELNSFIEFRKLSVIDIVFRKHGQE